MKAILVMDMPSGCLQCEFSTDDDFTCFCIVNSTECSTVTRPDWCPLKPMPKKKEDKQYRGNGVFGINTAMETRFNQGYNACIDEILGDKE